MVDSRRFCRAASERPGNVIAVPVSGLFMAALVPTSLRQGVGPFPGVLDTSFEQYLTTMALGVAFLVVVWLIYWGGRPLKRWFTGEAVDIARTMLIMAAALGVGGLVVIVWGAQADVYAAVMEFSNALIPGTDFAVRLFVAFIALLATYTLTRITKRGIRYYAATDRISPHQREVAHHAVQLGLFFLAITFIFVLFDQNPRDLILGAGVLGIVLGLAARKTLSGVLSGFVILFGRPFEAGDWVAIGDREGIVTEITVFNTQIRTFNEEHVLVPNDTVTANEVINYSKTDRLRILTEVGVDYDADIATAVAIATTVMEDCESVADTPAPDVVVEGFGDSAVVLQLRYWIDQPTIQRKLRAQNEVVTAVKTAFEEADIKIPYPQREIMGREETDGFRVTTPADGTVEINADDRGGQRQSDRQPDVEEPVEEEYAGDGSAIDQPDRDREDDRDEETRGPASDLDRDDGGETSSTEKEGEKSDTSGTMEGGKAEDGDVERE